MASGDLAQYHMFWNLDSGSTSPGYMPVPFDGKIKLIQSALYAAISTANAVITVSVNGVAVNGGTLTIAFSGSAAGDYDEVRLSGEHVTHQVKKGDVITVVSDGGPSDNELVYGTIVIDRS